MSLDRILTVFENWCSTKFFLEPTSIPYLHHNFQLIRNVFFIGCYTTLSISVDDLAKTAELFSRPLIPFLEMIKYIFSSQLIGQKQKWCSWLSNVLHFRVLMIDHVNVEVVDELKLFGITVDHNLFFNKHVIVSIRLSIKNYTRLKFSVSIIKIQFFKTFI